MRAIEELCTLLKVKRTARDRIQQTILTNVPTASAKMHRPDPIQMLLTYENVEDILANAFR